MLTSSQKDDSFPFRQCAVLIGGGILFCAYLMNLFYFNETGKFCELFGTDCASVIRSAYGSFWGISTACLGLSYFIFHFSLLIGLKRIPSMTPEMISLLAFLLSIIGLGFSLYFIYVLQVILKQKCLACYGIHLINAVLFLLYLVRVNRVRHFFTVARIKAVLADSKIIAAGVFSFLIALNIVFGTGFLEAKYQLASERKKLAQNLNYYRYLYYTSEDRQFVIDPEDIVVGEDETAAHEIVLFFKENCEHCRQAKEKLRNIVSENYAAVYLVMKNAEKYSGSQLAKWDVTKVPAVFVDGKKADGWDVPGFLTEFTEDCGC